MMGQSYALFVPFNCVGDSFRSSSMSSTSTAHQLLWLKTLKEPFLSFILCWIVSQLVKASLTGLRASLGVAEIKFIRKQDKIMDTSIYRGTPLRPTSLMGKPLPPLEDF